MAHEDRRSGGHLDDEKINVVVLKEHKKSHKYTVVEKDTKELRDAAKRAAYKCGKWHSVRDYERLAKKVEKKDLKWEWVCSYEDKKNKHVKYHVVFSDNGDKRYDGHRDGKKDH